MPTNFSARIARNTQLILSEKQEYNEVDPLAGSYYVESLTSEIVKESKKLMEEIDEVGGMVKAIELGILNENGRKVLLRDKLELTQKEETIVGVNKYKPTEKQKINILSIDNEKVRKQISRLEAIKKSRDKKIVESYLEKIKNAASVKIIF